MSRPVLELTAVIRLRARTAHKTCLIAFARANAIRVGRTCPRCSALPFWICSQGGVQFPTGGMGETPSPRAPPPQRGVSRSGERPGPTVTVRMEENVREPPFGGGLRP